MRIKDVLIPQDRSFYDALERISRNVLTGADRLYNLVTKAENFQRLQEERDAIKKLEREGDEMTQEVFKRLNQVFITPIDREDISDIARAFDDVLDFIYATINRLYLYEISTPTKPIIHMAEIIVKSVNELNEALLILRSRKNFDDISSRCDRVKQLEVTGDEILNTSIAQLFKEKNPVDIIKLKEIYENLENVTDKCEDVADVLRSIVLKYA